MISNYKVKNENNEKVLYIYLDFNYEFGEFKNFGKKIREYLNNILYFYKANKVKIMVEGILIATLFVVPISTNETNKNNIIYINQSTLKSNSIVVKNSNTIENINNIIEKKDIESIKYEEQKAQNDNISNNYVSDSINENIINNNVSDSINENIVKNDVNDNIYVTVNRSNGTILSIELEKYLIGVLASEMPASFNIEALKAQAVAIRTYTLKRISENKILTDTTSTQVYKDDDELKKMWGNDYLKYYNKIKNAVDSTKGIYMTYGGEYIDAVYHSTSNGYTEDAIYVWGYDVPYLKSVESSTDKNASSYKREIIYSYSDIKEKLNIDINNNSIINLTKNNSNRVTEISIDNNLFNGIDFRHMLNLRSTDFNIVLNENDIVITTYGYGHGVGMSEYGANGMANNGYDYIGILNHYYQNIKIES